MKKLLISLAVAAVTGLLTGAALLRFL